jgi:hypothetical protein
MSGGRFDARCPLCASLRTRPFAAHARRYFDCDDCGLVHLDPSQRVSDAEARAEYEAHENDPSDPRYRAFLNRLAEPLLARLPAASIGLDYGSGPGPTLGILLEEVGHAVRLYDPLFCPDAAALTQSYDFVTATEVVEHFFEPATEFARLFGLVKPGGWLGVMTGVLEPDRDFTTWHYPRERTHVSFYRQQTWQWLAERHGVTWERPHPNVALFRRRGVDAAERFVGREQ